MKFILFALLSVSTAAFLTHSPTRIASSSQTVMAAVSGLDNRRRGPRLGEDSTKPIADRQVSWMERATMRDVILDPDYTLAASVALLCPLIIWYHPCESWLSELKLRNK